MGRILLQNRRIELQNQQIELQTGRIQLQKPVNNTLVCLVTVHDIHV